MDSIAHRAQLIRTGALSARRNVEESVVRYEASGLHAYQLFDAEGALDQATAIDHVVARGADPGPLAGITISVKDLYGVADLPIRAGTKRELPPRWQEEGFLVRRLRELGGIVIGKTHTVELAYGAVGLNPNTGTPVNPWDPNAHRAPGGSSSGAGVSLQEGTAQIALGTDTGGSIRIPAAATGVVGHKQTRGRWPTTGVVPLSTTLDTVGFLTNTVLDTAYVFAAIEGVPVAAAGRGSLDGLRIGVPRSALWSDADPAVSSVARRAVEELAAAGALVRDVEAPELDEAGTRYLSGGIVPSECAAFLRRSLPGWLETLDPTVGRRLEAAAEIRAMDYVETLHQRAVLARSVDGRFEEWDVLATPTVPITPPRLDTLGDLDSYMEANRRMLSGTCPVSMLDLCAITLPVGLDDSGMPVGLQLMARNGADLDLLGWASAAELVLGASHARLGRPPGLG